MAKTVKHIQKTAGVPTFADAVALREKANALMAQAQDSLDAFQAKAWEVLRSNPKVRVHEEFPYKDTEGNLLGTGPQVNGDGSYQGIPFSFFTRWNRSEGKPTLVFKGLFASGEKAEKDVVTF